MYLKKLKRGTSMIGNIFKKIFGTKNDREVKRIRKIVAAINSLEPDFEKLTDEYVLFHLSNCLPPR